jgi:hypothetical protein
MVSFVAALAARFSFRIVFTTFALPTFASRTIAPFFKLAGEGGSRPILSAYHHFF